MKTCPKCNQTMADTFTFCGVCGTPLPDGEPDEVQFEEDYNDLDADDSSSASVLPPLDFVDHSDNFQPLKEEHEFQDTSSEEMQEKRPFLGTPPELTQEEDHSFLGAQPKTSQMNVPRRPVPRKVQPVKKPHPMPPHRVGQDSNEPGSHHVPERPKREFEKKPSQPPSIRRRALESMNSEESMEQMEAAARSRAIQDAGLAPDEGEPFTPIPAYASHEAQVPGGSPFAPMNKGAIAKMEAEVKAEKKVPAQNQAFKSSNSSSNSLFNTDKTGLENTKPCPRCGAVTYPYDKECCFCGYKLAAIRRINVGAVVAALAMAFAVFLPYISAYTAYGRQSMSLFGKIDGYIFLGIAAITFVIALTGRNAFVIAMGGIAAAYTFYETSIRIYQLSEEQWGIDLVYRAEMSYYIFIAATAAIIITGIVGAINFRDRNKQKMKMDVY